MSLLSALCWLSGTISSPFFGAPVPSSCSIDCERSGLVTQTDSRCVHRYHDILRTVERKEGSEGLILSALRLYVPSSPKFKRSPTAFIKVALQVTFQGSGGGSGRRCCARQQLRARESFTRWCHPASPRPGDSSTSRQEGSPPYSIQPDCWCSVACAMLLLEVVDRGAEVEVVLPVPTTVLWRRF